MEKQILKRVERIEDGEREKLRELLKDSKQTYVTVSQTCVFVMLWCN